MCAVAARRRRLPATRHVVRILVPLAGTALAAWVIAGKRDEISGASSYLDHLRAPWIVLGVGFEVLSVLAFAGLQGRLLRSGDIDAAMPSLTAITLAGNSIQNSLPGGGAWASAWAWGQFRRLGADDVLATWMLFAVAASSGVALALVAGVGVALAEGDAAALDLVRVVLAILVAASGLVLLARRGTIGTAVERLVRLSQRMTGRPRGDVTVTLRRLRERLVAVTPAPRDWAIALGWALGNWGWDCACLATAFLAVGAPVPWRSLLLAYGAGQLAANLPITPGGLGVVEGSLTLALVAYGGSELSTVAAVLLYRLISFWALLPVGWLTLGTLTVKHRRRQDVVA